MPPDDIIRIRHMIEAANAATDFIADEPLAVVEAMKMENVLRAERDGTIKRIAAKAG